LIGLLAGEYHRDTEGNPVAYLAGNKQLAQQVERQARELGFPVVRFQGPKDTWQRRDVRAFSFGESIGVMNYWNYFNASPDVEPAGMLILDDVHLLEGPLRDLFTVSIGPGDGLYKEVLERIVERCPYYSLVVDLLNGVDPIRPPEMLVFPDSADLSDGVRDLLDARLVAGSEPWWGWQRIRDRLEICCWLVSPRAVTFTPYIPPTQTLAHFSEPTRRLYMSATVGSVDDLHRRLGTPPAIKLTAAVQPRQGRTPRRDPGEYGSAHGGEQSIRNTRVTFSGNRTKRRERVPSFVGLNRHLTGSMTSLPGAWVFSLPCCWSIYAPTRACS
jgi:hypothetical protein